MAFVVSALPGLPGAWGTADATYVLFFGLAGLPAGIALAVCLSYRMSGTRPPSWARCCISGARGPDSAGGPLSSRRGVRRRDGPQFVRARMVWTCAIRLSASTSHRSTRRGAVRWGGLSLSMSSAGRPFIDRHTTREGTFS